MVKGEAAYTPVSPSTSDDIWPNIPSRSFSIRKVVSLSLAIALSTVLLFVEFLPRPAPLSELQLERLWGPYAPYYFVEEYQPPPDRCRVTQASALSSDVV